LCSVLRLSRCCRVGFPRAAQSHTSVCSFTPSRLPPCTQRKILRTRVRRTELNSLSGKQC